MSGGLKRYKAIIFLPDLSKADSQVFRAERVSVLAAGLTDAREQLEHRYGKGAVHDLHSEEDAAKPR